MKRQQRWIPDTCANPATGDACSFIEEWDDEVDPVARVHSFIQAEKLCSHHAAIHGSDHATAYSSNYVENRRKNKAFTMAIAIRNPPIPHDELLSVFKWSFDTDRNLTIDFGTALTSAEKQQLRDNMDIQFGRNKVRLLP